LTIMQLIEFKVNEPLSVTDVIDLFESSGIDRPTNNPERIRKMLDKANLIVSAWEGDKLIGIARSLTDFAYCTYLSDLAVRREYQKRKVGSSLIQITRSEVGEASMLLLLSNESAMGYYPKLGFERASNAFMLKRQSK